MEYTAVIRTLGKAGEKFQKLLDSLAAQTLKPSAIIVYIADGYPIPSETIGVERYVYVKKGMIAQRALPYDEVNTEYILFLDDDLQFPPDTVETMFRLLQQENADVISPDIFPNAERPFGQELMMTLSGRMRSRKDDGLWGYKVMRTAGYSYNRHPSKEIYQSQTNAGACFLCRKRDFTDIHFEEELWLDRQGYALGEDQVMFYKMYLNGLKILTWYRHGFIHLDGGVNLDKSKKKNVIYADFFFKTVFWHRFIYKTEMATNLQFLNVLSIGYAILFAFLVSLIKFDYCVFKIKYTAVKDAISFISNDKYKTLSPIKRHYNV